MARENQTRRYWGFEPRRFSLAQKVVFIQRSIRVLRHWPCDPGGMTVCGLSFRVTVDETADYATQVQKIGISKELM